MPEGFNTIADLKIVVDANTEKLHGGLELAQGLISRFKKDADGNLSGFDAVMQKAAGGVSVLVTRLGAVGMALGVAAAAIDTFKEYGRQFAEQTGTQEHFAKLEASVDDLQDAIVGGLQGALTGAASEVAGLVTGLASLESQQNATAQTSGSMAAIVQERLTVTITDLSYLIRQLGPDSEKSFKQLEREITEVTDRIKDLRGAGQDIDVITFKSWSDFFLGGSVEKASEFASALEAQLFVMQQFAGMEKLADESKARVEADKAAAAAVEKSVEAMDREIKGLESKAAVLGMTAAAQAAYIANQRVMAELDGAGVEMTAEVRKTIDERVGRIRELTLAVENHNKAERGRQQGEQRERQIDRTIEALDQEIAAQMRKTVAVGRTNAEMQASERVERALLAIRQAGREPTTQEIADIHAKGDALRDLIQTNEDLKKKMGEMQEYARAVTSSLESAFRKFAQTGKFEVKDMVRSMLQDLAMLAMRQNVFGPLQQGLTGALSSVFGGAPMPAFAEGGRPPTDRPSIVGERGIEVFMPDTAGTIIPNHMLQALGAGGGQQRAGGEVLVRVSASPELYVEIDNRAEAVAVKREPRLMQSSLEATRQALPGMISSAQSRVM